MKIQMLCGALFALHIACTPDNDPKHPEPLSPTVTTTTHSGTPGDPADRKPTREGTMTDPAVSADSPGAMSSPPGSVGAGSPMNTADGPRAMPRYSDAEVASILEATNSGEIDKGKMAQSSTKDAGVNAFARTMVDHHSEARDKLARLFSKLAMAPVDSTRSREMKATSLREIDTLKGLKDTDFDRAYLDAQIRDHKDALWMLDRFLPSIQSLEFKTMLQEVRGRADQHLKAAQELKSKLSNP